MPADHEIPRPWHTSEGGGSLTIRLRLTPKSSRDEIGGIVDTPDGPAIAAKVRAIPEKGAANKALIALAAKWLGVPKSSVELTAGGKSRNKILSLSGAGPDAVARLETLVKTE